MSLTPRLDAIDKNYLINGNFDFWQRGTSFTSVGYTSDRWRSRASGATVTRQSSTISGSQYVLQFAAISQEIGLEQRIESNLVRLLAGKEVTVSVKARATSGTPTLSLLIQTPTATDDWSSSSTIITQTLGTLNSTFQTFKHTFTVSASMASTGFNVVFSCGTVTATVQFGQAMLNLGPDAREFTLAGRDYTEELRLCQRYYEKSYSLNTSPGTSASEGALANNPDATVNYLALGTVRFISPKRTTPSMLLWNPVTGLNTNPIRNFTGSSNGPGATGGINQFSFYVLLDSFSVPVANFCGTHWTADAEL